MSDIPNLSGKVGLDVTDFKANIAEINRNIRVVESGFRSSAAALGDWGKSASGLETRIKALNSEIDLQKNKVTALTGEYERIAKEKGDTSRAAQELQIKLNKENETLGKMQTELGQTEGALRGMKNESGKLGTAVKSFGSQLNNLKQQVPALGTAFNLLTNPISLAVAGIGTFVAISKKAIKETVDYNQQVREMMQLTGLSAEETSRIIQVADDWGLSIGQVRSALELMNKKGITPSIDNLAIIADEYVNATDKSAFMEEATKKYGKSFGDLIPILAKGGDALRDQAGAIADNMLATDESIKNSREWEVQLDDLQDTIQGLEYTLAEGLLPTANNVLETINKLIGTAMKEESAASRLKKAVQAGTISRKEYDKAMWSLRIGTNAYIDILQELTYREAIEKQKQEQLNAESDKLDHVRGSLTTTTNEAATAEEELARATEEATYQEKLAQAAADRLNQKYDDLNSVINGRLGPEMEDFNKTQGELNTKMGEIQEEIDKAIKDGYDPLGEKVLGLKDDYNKLKGQYDENATAHDEATKRILFDILEQRLSLGGLTEDEEKLLERQALAWGLVDQATLDVMDRYDEAGKYLATHKGDWDNAEKIINGQETAWSLAQKAARDAKIAVDDYSIALNNLDGKTVNTEIITTFTQRGKPGEAIGNQQGANFTIPPGYNENYPIGYGSSGEHVIILPQGQGERFGDALATIQQLMAQSITGLNNRASAIAPKGDTSSKIANVAAPIQIFLQGAPPDDEMKMRRQARYIVDEIQRKQR